MDLNELRNKLDVIDAEMVRLYEERMAVCEGVAEYKIANNKPVLDTEREAAKLSKLSSLTHSESNSKAVKELFEQIMCMSRKLQYTKMSDDGVETRAPFIQVDDLDIKNSRVVYQGADGAYSQMAMMAYFGEDVDSFHVDSFRDAMAALEEGRADYAVLPIENSTAGAIDQSYDLLVEFENYIVGEQIIKIEHCLMGPAGATENDIKTVYSHPQSLLQSARFLNSHPDWQQISMQNNAFAAKKVKDDNDKTQAAIASEHAAKIYGLEVIKKGVNQSESNSTRFVIVANKKIYKKGADKISICMEVSHESGSLYHMLSHFIYNDLNMTKIESRPIEDRNWEYRFFIEFNGNINDPAVRNALRGLREESRSMKILGCY